MEALLEYEQMGLTTTTPAPSSLLSKLKKDRQGIMMEGVEERVNTALTKAEVATTPKSSITHTGKALLAIADAEKQLDDLSTLSSLRERVEVFIHKDDAELAP